MLGINAFSEETVTREIIQNSVGNLQSKIETLKVENEKALEGLRLELVQLMEQGNQVVKSPWASWQFGINYMYNLFQIAIKPKVILLLDFLVPLIVLTLILNLINFLYFLFLKY